MGQTNHSAAGPYRSTRAQAEDAERDAEQEEHEQKRDEQETIDEKGQAEDRDRQDQHHHEADRARRDARKHQAGEVLRDRQRRREEVQEVARPDVFEERRRHAVHDAGEEVPEQHGPEQHRDEVESGRGDGVEIAGDEPPQHDVDSRPTENRQQPRAACPRMR